MLIQFDHDNACLEGDNKAGEIARLLRHIADQVEAGAIDGDIIDYTGYRIGVWAVCED